MTIIYSIYKGDKFIDQGTAYQLANKLGVKVSTIQFMATPRSFRRNKGNRMVAYREYI